MNTTTAATTSEARQQAERIRRIQPDIKANRLPLLGIPAPSMVSNEEYAIGYFNDHSILIWARGEDLTVLDEDRIYYRDTVDHLARCLGIFTQERRAEMLKGESQWIDGIHWAADGSFIEI